jgi:hypothetical protein
METVQQKEVRIDPAQRAQLEDFSTLTDISLDE